MKHEKEIRGIIKELGILTQPVDSVGIESPLQSAGMDSISFVSLIIALEDFFDIEFPDEYLLITETGCIEQLCAAVEICGEKREETE